jgi:hypothetical protein
MAIDCSEVAEQNSEAFLFEVFVVGQNIGQAFANAFRRFDRGTVLLRQMEALDQYLMSGPFVSAESSVKHRHHRP